MLFVYKIATVVVNLFVSGKGGKELKDQTMNLFKVFLLFSYDRVTKYVLKLVQSVYCLEANNTNGTTVVITRLAFYCFSG